MKRIATTISAMALGVLQVSGVPVDGETYRQTGEDAWSTTGSYSGLTMGVWKGGAVPSGGGTAR